MAHEAILADCGREVSVRVSVVSTMSAAAGYITRANGLCSALTLLYYRMLYEQPDFSFVFHVSERLYLFCIAWIATYSCTQSLYKYTFIHSNTYTNIPTCITKFSLSLSHTHTPRHTHTPKCVCCNIILLNIFNILCAFNCKFEIVFPSLL